MSAPELYPENRTPSRFLVGAHRRQDEAEQSAVTLRAAGHNVEVVHNDQGFYIPGWEVWIVRHGSGGSLPDSVIFGGGR